jgi:hypothetical protein
MASREPMCFEKSLILADLSLKRMFENKLQVLNYTSVDDQTMTFIKMGNENYQGSDEGVVSCLK